MSLVSLKNVSYSYPQSDSKVLDDISFDVEKGEYIAILGKNGSGKSTLARLMARFFKPDYGEYILQKGVLPGIVFQQPKEQIVAGIVERDTSFGPRNLDMSEGEIELRTIECLSVVGLTDKAESKTFELSLGQTQRVAFSGILALFPDLLILDEVTAMLDPKVREELVKFIDQWSSRGNTIIHITHDEDEALRANRIIVLEEGKLIFDGTRKEFISNKKLVDNIFCTYEKIVPRNFENNEETLKVKNLSFSYDDKNIFENISFSLKKGTLTAITGPSGCGKSTLFECLSGLKKCDSGNIYAKSRPVLAMQESDAALFENFVADDVAFGPLNNNVKGKELLKRVKSSMELVSLPYEEYANRNTFNLSGGEKRKLSIAGIIALDKDILIFDEPTSALDSHSRKVILETLRKLADEGKTVLFSTHRLEELSYADKELKWSDLNLKSQDSKENHLTEYKSLENIKLLTTFKKAADALMTPPVIPKSLISILPAVLKFILFLGIFVSSVVVKSFSMMLIMFLANILYGLLAKFSWKKVFVSMRILFPWLIIFAIFQMAFYSSEGNIIFSWKFFVLTDEKLYSLGIFFLRAISAIISISVFIFSTDEREILDGLSALLKPLALIKIPVRYFVLVVGIIFRFIPLLIDEMTGIIKTQIIRGIFGNAKGLKKLKVLVPLFVPLMLQTFRKAQTLADALTARYFK